LFFSIDEVPHLIELHDLNLGRCRGLRQSRGLLANPFENSHFADAKEPCDHAVAGIPHGVEQHRPTFPIGAFIAAGLPRLGVSMKLQPQSRQG
jgi:hypothetical protein